MSNPASAALNQANPHALAAIIEASVDRTILACRDILDESGMKLWARDQPVSASLQQRLFERKLRHPLESCLLAEDGVSVVELHAAACKLFEQNDPLAQVVQPWQGQILNEIKHMPLHAAAQLILTALQAARPAAFEHAIRGMVLAGAMSASASRDHYRIRLALLGGLLHDIGEIYLDPVALDPTLPMTPEKFRYLSAHSRIGEVLISGLTDYPPALIKAIGEHHQRLDGTGYPFQRQDAALSELGRDLCATEAMLGLLAIDGPSPLARTSFGLRFVPGEFDPSALAFITNAAKTQAETVEAPTVEALRKHIVELQQLADAIDNGLKVAQLLCNDISQAVVSDIAGRALQLLRRLKMAWNASGFWTVDGESLDDPFEVEAAKDELAYRLRYVQREALLPEKSLAPEDAYILESLWKVLIPSPVETVSNLASASQS